MAAKPRVHEVASEMGVDSKTALAVLKSMGEFVKGPSSSIQPPVAVRLRAALADPDNPPPRDQLQMRAQGARALLIAQRLPRDLPEFAALLATVARGMTPGQRLLREVVAEENFYYAPSASASSIEEGSARARRFDVEALPTLNGLAVLCRAPGRSFAPEWLLAWRASERRVEVVQTPFRLRPDGSPALPSVLDFGYLEYLRARVTDGFAVVPVGADGPLRRLAGLMAAIPESPERVDADGLPADAPTGQGRGRSDAQTGTQLVYLRRHVGHDRGNVTDGSNRRDSQWVVRGHWRDQWYPSQKEHKRIWIDPHVAGNADAPLSARSKVYVIRPLAASTLA